MIDKRDAVKLMVLIVIGTIIYAALITLPVSTTKEDIFFEVTVTNNILNQPKITNVEVYTKPATLLPSSFAMASLLRSDELRLETRVGSKIVTKSVGELDIIDTAFTDNERTVYYRLPGMSEYTGYKIYLIENERYIDLVEGVI